MIGEVKHIDSITIYVVNISGIWTKSHLIEYEEDAWPEKLKPEANQRSHHKCNQNYCCIFENHDVNKFATRGDYPQYSVKL